MRKALASVLVSLLVGCAPVESRPSPTPNSTTATPSAPVACPQDGFTCVSGIVTTDTGVPFSDVCVVVGPGSMCSFVTGADGRFQANLTKSAAVTWTLYFDVNGAVLAVRQFTGPFDTDTIDAGTVSLPRVIQ